MLCAVLFRMRLTKWLFVLDAYRVWCALFPVDLWMGLSEMTALDTIAILVA